MDELTSALYDIGCVISGNAKDEGGAINGYTEQLKAIQRAVDIARQSGREDLVTTLESLYEKTEEKISDELNHAQSLNNEYSELMGIAIPTD